MPAPANDNITAAELLAGNSGTATGTTVEATLDTPYDPLEDQLGTSSSVWYKIQLHDGWNENWRLQIVFTSEATLTLQVIGLAPGETFPFTDTSVYSSFDTLTSPNDPPFDRDTFLVDPSPDDGYVYIGVGDFGAPGAFSFSWAFIQPPVETLERPSWRWIITQLRTSRVLTSVTTIATEITTSRLLAGSWPAALTVPSDDPRVRTTFIEFEGHPEWDEPFVAKDVRVLVGLRNSGVTDPLWECAYSGIVKQVTDRVSDGVPQTTINCWDARKYLEFLPLVDADGNLPDADGITFSDTANAIARAALENWITNNPGCLAETLFDLSGGLDETCVELTMTFDRGTTINDVWTQLEQAGAIDIVLDPVFDPRGRPGCIAVVNFEVEHGTARHAAIFSWDRSPRSLPEIGRMEDGLKDANTIQDYTDDVEPAVAATDTDSVTRIGEYWAMRAWPGQQEVDAVTAFAISELEFRKNGQTTVEATPAAPRSLQPIQEYDIGDRVPVYASERLRKPIAATMRIYGVPFTIDESARETVAGLVVSADAVT